MPIVQQRLIDLIEITTESMDRFKDIRESHFWELIYKRLSQRHDTELTEAFAELKSYVDRRATLPQELVEKYFHERAHFNLRRKMNDRNRTYIRKYRGQEIEESQAIQLEDMETQIPEIPFSGYTCPRCKENFDADVISECPRCGRAVEPSL